MPVAPAIAPCGAGNLGAADKLFSLITLVNQKPVLDASNRGNMRQPGATPAIPRILVVDDESVVLDILAQMLKALGYEVRSAFSGEEGMALLDSNAFDLVFTDYLMPDMDGFELARGVKQTAPDCPVIMITGQPLETIHDQMASGTVDLLLYKPFVLHAIRQATRVFLNDWCAPCTRQTFVVDR